MVLQCHPLATINIQLTVESNLIVEILDHLIPSQLRTKIMVQVKMQSLRNIRLLTHRLKQAVRALRLNNSAIEVSG